VDPPALDDLAEAVRTRPFSLLRAFKEATGLPPHAYLTTVRVRRARELLDLGMPPARVAAEVGFTDQAHLTRHFKRAVGVTPGAYRLAQPAGAHTGSAHTGSAHTDGLRRDRHQVL
jgi:AraC-like DNA-binding protein